MDLMIAPVSVNVQSFRESVKGIISRACHYSYKKRETVTVVKTKFEVP